MEQINKLSLLYKLKNVERANSVINRKESSAEHSWSCLFLADYFLNVMNNSSLNRLKIYEMLIYHDIVEIETGDINLIDTDKRVDKQEKELQAMRELKDKLPEAIKEKTWNLFVEFEEGNTKEAKFCKAIDALDSQIHEMDYKEDWKGGWTEEFLRSKKGKYFEDWPELKDAFNKVIKFCNDDGYFDQ